MPELILTSPYVDSRVDYNTCTMSNPMPESTLTLCQSRLYIPVRDLVFGLCSYFLLFFPPDLSLLFLLNLLFPFHVTNVSLSYITSLLFNLSLSLYISSVFFFHRLSPRDPSLHIPTSYFYQIVFICIRLYCRGL
jgi:hypothetical protein